MAKNTNNKDLLKKYSNALRERLDKELYITPKELEVLISKYQISKDDLFKIETLSNKFLKSSKEKIEFGSWREAEDLAIESLCLTPFDKNSLTNYLDLIIEKKKDLGTEKPNEYKIYLDRLAKIDKHLYKKYINNEKRKLNKKLMLLLLLPLLIPILVILKKEPKRNTLTKKVEKPIVLSSIGNRSVEAIFVKNPNYKLEYKIVESTLTGYQRDYNYTLKTLISSESLNISYIEGKIIWYNQFDERIFSEKISTPKGPTYYINEDIPLTYLKNSKRISPDLYRVEIFIDNIISTEGLERTDEKPIETTFNSKKSYDIEVKELSNEITYGVASDYLSLTLKINNIGKQDINFLEVELIWYDFYNLEKYKKRIKLIDSKDIVLKEKSSRVIPLIFEVKELQNSYKIEVLRINK